MITFWRNSLDEGCERIRYSAEVQASGLLEMSSGLHSISHLKVKGYESFFQGQYYLKKTSRFRKQRLFDLLQMSGDRPSTIDCPRVKPSTFALYSGNH